MIEIPQPSERALALHAEATAFLQDSVLPAEAIVEEWRRKIDPADHSAPPVVADLAREARSRGLWNLFLPSESGLTQREYAPIAELSGWSLELAPVAMNCQAPDTGNMELLHLVGTKAQQEQWLGPLMEGQIRSAFAMTEPDVASSDATNIATRIERDGDGYRITGRKWWTSGILDPDCKVLIVLGVSDPDGPAHARHTMVIVPRDAAGIEVERDLSVLGHHHRVGHGLVRFDGVRVGADAVLGEHGGGFAAAQARLGPGRIHHCMRALGAGERALAMTVARAKDRIAFGKPLAEQGTIRADLARSRVELDQARLICLYACHVIDTQGNKAARNLVAQAKVVIPRVVAEIIDRAIQVHGGAGVSDVTPLAEMYSWHRAMRLFDGPDEVHLEALARTELKREPALRLPALVY
ncbi:MAG: acyl-CoA dehydrogenase family protein [Sporichthyaceae bacterium]